MVENIVLLKQKVPLKNTKGKKKVLKLEMREKSHQC